MSAHIFAKIIKKKTGDTSHNKEIEGLIMSFTYNKLSYRELPSDESLMTARGEADRKSLEEDSRDGRQGLEMARAYLDRQSADRNWWGFPEVLVYTFARRGLVIKVLLRTYNVGKVNPKENRLREI